MQSYFKNFIVKYGSKICALAVMIAPMGVLSCRCQFYQPKEPKELYKILK